MALVSVEVRRITEKEGGFGIARMDDFQGIRTFKLCLFQPIRQNICKFSFFVTILLNGIGAAV